MDKEFLAHVKLSAGQWEIHHLEEHLRKVARLSGNFSTHFGKNSREWAMLAGIWHDLGKYSADFQKMISARSGYSAEAHLEGLLGKVNHSSAGALHAVKTLGNTAGKMLAYLIAGHHAGLPDWESNLKERLNLDGDTENQALYRAARAEDIPEDILNPSDWLNSLSIPSFLHPGGEGYQSISMSFWLRMLYSCLVDADFLDTEAFMDEARSKELRARQVDLAALEASFDHYMRQKIETSPSTPVNLIRKEILEGCLAKAADPTGIYTLTVPTGGGKTLTGLAYALKHALHHGQERIIYVLPFTSILEQTANVFREVFAEVGVDCVVEHHSAIETSRETVQSRLATENWDAPIILTTNVQFFESLFANRNSQCRKLHNIANSVVILDEAQQIPPEFKRPIEAALRLLANDYKTTIVLSTATQPVLDLGKTTELAPEPARLFSQLKRVQIQLPNSLTEPATWENLAGELADLSKVLCIVSRRDDAKTLFQLMPEGTIRTTFKDAPDLVPFYQGSDAAAPVAKDSQLALMLKEIQSSRTPSQNTLNKLVALYNNGNMQNVEIPYVYGYALYVKGQHIKALSVLEKGLRLEHATRKNTDLYNTGSMSEIYMRVYDARTSDLLRAENYTAYTTLLKHAQNLQAAGLLRNAHITDRMLEINAMRHQEDEGKKAFKKFIENCQVGDKGSAGYWLVKLKQTNSGFADELFNNPEKLLKLNFFMKTYCPY